jgi:hypothetical protein
MKISLRLIGVIGLLLFSFVFLITFISPVHFEKTGKEFIQAQVQKEVSDEIDNVKIVPLEKVAGLLNKKYGDEISGLKQKLKDGLPEKIAAITAEMQDLSCECRRDMENQIRQSFTWRIASLDLAREQLNKLIRGKYMDVVEKLMRDLRIFTGTNAFIFMLLLAVSFFRASAIAQLFLPAVLLVIATLVSSYFYVFEQNWFLNIVYNDYVGYGYIAYVSIVFLLLCDVVLNRAKVTTEILNALLGAAGRTASLTPC